MAAKNVSSKKEITKPVKIPKRASSPKSKDDPKSLMVAKKKTLSMKESLDKEILEVESKLALQKEQYAQDDEENEEQVSSDNNNDTSSPSSLDKKNLQERTWLLTYEAMFKRLRMIMKKVEVRIISSDKIRDVYVLMALYNQMREVIADLRSIIDLSQNTQRIIDKILYPLVRDISNNYVDVIFMIKKTLRSNVDSDKYLELKATLEECLREHAKYIQSSYEKSSEQLAKLLKED